MAKLVRLFRYYNQITGTTTKNYPTDLSLRHLVSGSAFSECPHILQLGIQSLPGTKFYLNNSNNPVIIGSTGIYELDLNGLSEITALSFDQKSVQAVSSNNNAFLIIDIIYEDGED